MRKELLLLPLFMLASVCSAQITQVPAPRFEEIGKQAGLRVSHVSSPEKRYILESMSGGIGLIDCDNDGKLDILAVNGSTVDRYRNSGGDLLVTLYHQDSSLKFSDITAAAHLTRKGWGMGIAAADYDNDGLPDFYVTGYNGNALYHNLGSCKFEDVTIKAGVEGTGFSTGAAWADYDRDGHVDLFVSRYVHVEMEKLPTPGSDAKFCRYRGLLVQCGPWGMQGESDFLFHNRGNGTFEEVSKKSGVDDPNRYYGLGAVWGDYNNDGWPDLYVANDAGPNFLYRNLQDGTFAEEGLSSGAAVSGDGQEQGSMGVDWGDFDHDGRLDIVVTNFVDQSDTLYRNQGARGFLDVTGSSRLAAPTRPYVGWGTALFDVDNSGWALDVRGRRPCVSAS
jgi:enediyne biosynthesis protein E4